MEYIAVFLRGEAEAATYSDDLLHLPRWGEHEWRSLFARTGEQQARASEIVIQLGADDRTLYFVVSGALEVGSSYVDGMSMSPLAKIVAGSVVGEQSFFDGMPRSASVWAVNDCTLLKLPFREFEAFAREYPVPAQELAFALGRVLSVRLRNTTMRIRR
ncbi:MAG TPA: cyclic nucleotide-binding domain-containing protein [Burkholderiales bacterium]|nr:cyclic nucleotide-binding domain-containing protein [Burkholderiales bacterium]